MIPLLIIAGVLALVVMAVLGYASTKPDEFRVVRSAVMNAPPEKVFPLINDFHRWTEWSPWEHKDPNLKRTYSGSASGVGAAYDWEGNKNVGKGRMDILESQPFKRIYIKLHFMVPFESVNHAEFKLEPEGGGTKVTWTMSGASKGFHKVLCVFMNMDKMIGKDFEQGLANMNAAAQK